MLVLLRQVRSPIVPSLQVSELRDHFFGYRMRMVYDFGAELNKAAFTWRFAHSSLRTPLAVAQSRDAT